MKKLFTALALALTLTAGACWIGGEPPVSTADYELRIDGKTASGVMTVALPAQLDLRFLSNADAATLQYRVEGGEWITVATLKPAECKTTSSYIPAFGRYTFTPAMMGEAPKFQFRIQVIRGVYQSISLSDPSAGAMNVTISNNRRPR